MSSTASRAIWDVPGVNSSLPYSITSKWNRVRSQFVGSFMSTQRRRILHGGTTYPRTALINRLTDMCCPFKILTSAWAGCWCMNSASCQCQQLYNDSMHIPRRDGGFPPQLHLAHICWTCRINVDIAALPDHPIREFACLIVIQVKKTYIYRVSRSVQVLVAAWLLDLDWSAWLSKFRS